MAAPVSLGFLVRVAAEADVTLAASVGVTVGDGWAVVTLRGRACDGGDACLARLRSAAQMLAVAGALDAPALPVRVTVTGVDARALGADPDFIRQATDFALAEATAAVNPLGLGPGGFARAPPPESARSFGPAADCSPLARPAMPEPPHEATPEPDRGASRRAAVRPAARETPEGAKIAAMARQVSEHIAKHGAAPRFDDETPAGRVKAYNFIRSVVGWARNLSDEAAEHVRAAVAAG